MSLALVLVSAPAAAEGRCPSAVELQVAELINEERAKEGLSPLVVDVRLVEAAYRHSSDMARNDFFSHTGSDGSHFSQRMVEAGYPFLSGGETIAGGADYPSQAVALWMGSIGHRAILLGNWQHVGVGFAFDADSTWKEYWTADFGRGTNVLSECGPPALVFTDGFESGSTSAWTVPTQ